MIEHPAPEEFFTAAEIIQRWAFEHSRTLHEKPVGESATPQFMKQLLDEPAPEAGRPFAEVFRRFEEDIVRYGYLCTHPRFLAFVPGAPCLPSMLGDWLSAAVNFFCGVWFEAAGPTQIEMTVTTWFADLLGVPGSFRGILTSGGSEANLTALVTAREPIPHGERNGLVIYVSEQRHWSIDRASRIMGISPTQIQPIPDDPEFRLRGEALTKQIHRDRKDGKTPWLVVANGGATNTGTVDPLDEIADVVKREGLWLHVDAAYGWAASLTPQGREQLRGIERADSITLDPHKWFAQTFDVGCVLIRRGKLLEDAFSLRPDYMQDVVPGEQEINFADHGLALTRKFRALKIWLSVQMLGMSWFRKLVEQSLHLAEYAANRIRHSDDFEILSPPRLSILCFRYRGTDARNDFILRELRASGFAFLSSTKLRGRFAIRMCFINWRTTERDVDAILDKMREIAQSPHVAT